MTDTVIDDAALKAKHRALWASGDYAAVARDVIPALGGRLVAACRVGPGQDVLDVAAGTGNAALPAARLGARVQAVDLVPELLDQAAHAARAEGVALTTRQGDAEALPYPDAGFDVVMSCVGVMFAPHHRVAASELLRVCRPGGTIGLINWTPEGFIGQLFAALRPFVAAPPPGALPPPLWGDPAHVRDLLDGGVNDLEFRRELLEVDTFETPEAFRDFFRDKYGPTLAAYRLAGDDADRLDALDDALLGLAAAHLHQGHMEWEYLLTTARRA